MLDTHEAVHLKIVKLVARVHEEQRCARSGCKQCEAVMHFTMSMYFVSIVASVAM